MGTSIQRTVNLTRVSTHRTRKTIRKVILILLGESLWTSRTVEKRRIISGAFSTSKRREESDAFYPYCATMTKTLTFWRKVENMFQNRSKNDCIANPAPVAALFVKSHHPRAIRNWTVLGHGHRHLTKRCNVDGYCQQ